MAKSPRKHTLCTPLSIDQWYIFGIFEHKWGTRKHIDDLKKIFMVHTSTKENWTYNLKGRNNTRDEESSTVAIFEDAKCRVVSLIKRLRGSRRKCVLRMSRECRERFPRHLLQRKLLVSDLGMHHGMCVTHVPWCMSGSLTPADGENVPGIPGACATLNFMYLVRGPLAWGIW